MRLSGSPRLQGRWLPRAIRGARLDRNPLRRGIDRVETCLLAGLFIVLAAGAPFAAQAASHAAYTGALDTRQQELATRHQVQAVLTSKAGAAGGYALNTHVLAPATWTSITGVRQSGDVPALPGSPKGTAVTVWADNRTGTLERAPLTIAEAAAQADATIVGATMAIGVVYVVAAGAIRQLANRRRMAAWEADWATTAPAWNRQRW